MTGTTKYLSADVERVLGRLMRLARVGNKEAVADLALQMYVAGYMHGRRDAKLQEAA